VPRTGRRRLPAEPFDPVVLRARVNSSLAQKRLAELEAQYQHRLAEQAAELARLRAELDRLTQGSTEALVGVGVA
jgi:cell division protein FtsB